MAGGEMKDPRAYRVIVTGWRGATAEQHGELVDGELFPIQLTYEPRNVTLVHGKCPYGGIDLIAANIAAGYGWNVEEHPPEVRDGRILGPARNRHMCSLGADIVVAFPGPGSSGTWDCLRWAQRYGIPFRGVGLSVPPGGRRAEAYDGQPGYQARRRL